MSCGTRSSRARERIFQDIKLALAADEGAARVLEEVDSEAGARLQRFPRRDRLGSL